MNDLLDLAGKALGGTLGGLVGQPALGAALGDAVAGYVGRELGLTPAEAAAAASTRPAEVSAALERAAQDPEFLARIAALAAEETARLRSVNETMRAEFGGDRVQRWWRPAMGYAFTAIVALYGLVVVLGLALLVADPGAERRAAADLLLNSIAQMTLFLSVPGAVVGVSAWGRSVELGQALSRTGRGR